jgi:hypothetical protein
MYKHNTCIHLTTLAMQNQKAYNECVALLIQHAKHKHHILFSSVASLALP